LPSQSFRVKNSLEVGVGVTITSGGNITAGILTATSFVGSGSQLTGVIASSGTATYASVSGVSSSVVGGAVSATSLSVVGVSTFDGAIKIRNGYNLNIGDNNDLRVYNDGTDSRIEETGSGSLYISGSDIIIQQHSTNKNFARFVGGAAELYYNDNKKFSTSGAGVTVTGTLVSDQINVSGFLTATSASFSGNVSVAGTLTYEDVTNIDSIGIVTARTGVRIDSGGLVVTAGVSTFTGNVSFGSSALFGYNKIIFGSGNSLEIGHSGGGAQIYNFGGGKLALQSSDEIEFRTPTGFYARFTESFGALLYDSNNQIKLQTIGSGVTITGTTFTNQLNVSGIATLGTAQISSGIITATSGIVTYYGDTSNTVSGRWTLGASGSSHYTFVGVGFTETTNDPTLYLKRGEVYEFINNSGGSHPFQIRVRNGGAAYNNGVTNNGSASGIIRFEVPYNAPDTLYYQCTNHSSMGGDIIILGGVRSIPQNSQTSAYILSASDIGKHISITTGGVTINTGIFSAGDAVSIYNNSGTSQTITQGTSVTLRQAGTANTGNRTLAQYGVCTVLCVGSETFVISGAGLS
jgi:hypothetical protein